jgi:hypothetical protein
MLNFETGDGVIALEVKHWLAGRRLVEVGHAARPVEVLFRGARLLNIGQ